MNSGKSDEERKTRRANENNPKLHRESGIGAPGAGNVNGSVVWRRTERLDVFFTYLQTSLTITPDFLYHFSLPALSHSKP